MKAALYFIYSGQPAAVRETTTEKAEQDIRYWLGKSPGIYRDELVDILVIPETVPGGWMKKIIDKIEREERAYEAKMHQEAERLEYQRLKSKFEK